MAAADGDVEQSLATKTATPIAQLGPELPDQETRKLHGEVTITWPFSSVSKSVAFLVAEPDFRLRRDRGQVRVQLNGPSAEAVGALELGSGDEVTLGLEGVEWARNEEPARPPGSRSDWQLKFVGKLTLKVTLGESQETKFISIDQPDPTEPEEQPEEPFEPIPFAEIDTTLFDDEPVAQKSARPAVNEYPSPVFIKRSRASYAPLFEFDLDEELEADGGRRGKGRKRPRYSVQNGRWKYREESSSPEPEISEDFSGPPAPTDGDVVMPDAPSKPQTADGACQTVELELLPPPKSVEDTPTRAPGGAPPSSPPLSGRLPAQYTGATTDTGVQASTSSLHAVGLSQQRPPPTAERPIASLFEPPPSTSGFSESDASFQAGFGIPQSVSHPTQDHQRTEPPQHLGRHAVPVQPHLGQPTHSQSMFGQSAFGQNVFGQPSSFGAGFATVGGPTTESVRFGFGEQPQSTFGGMPYASSQTPFSHQEAHLQSEAYPDPQQSPASASPPSHRSSEHVMQGIQSNQTMHETHTHVSEPQIGSSGAPLWAAGPQLSGPWHALGNVHNPEDLLSDSSAPVGTPPGMIPPGVEDGTRNQDEMREQGILSQPVFEQGVPREALPHGRESSADDEDSMDSDERADYDEDEKGDDYDMRNYNRISDDDDDFEDEKPGPLPDEDLLEEDEEFDEDEEDYDEEEDYEEDEPVHQNTYQQPILQRAPLPQAPKEPVVIDLLSDSEDDEAPAPPPPKSQLGRQQMDGIVNSEPENFPRGHAAVGSVAPTLQHRHIPAQSEQESDGSPEGEINDLEGEEEGSFVDEEELSEPENDEASEDDGNMDVDNPTHAEVSDDVERTSEIEVPYSSTASASQAEGASPSTGQSRRQSQLGEGSNIEGAAAKVDTTVENTHDQRVAGLVLDKEVDELSENQDEADERVAHLQPDPIELDATFRAQSRDVAASFETQVMDSAASNITSSSPRRGPISEDSHARSVDLNASFQTQTGDVVGSFQSQVLEPHTSLDVSSSPHRQGLDSVAAEDTLMDDGQNDGADDKGTSEFGEDASGQDMSEERAEQISDREPEVLNEKRDGAGTTGLEVTPNVRNETLESKSFEGSSDEQEEAPPSPPESQHREGPVTRSMDISMTTVSSHVETQVTDEKGAAFQTRDNENVLIQPDGAGGDTEMTNTDDKVSTTADQAVPGTGELESDSESVKNGRAASHDEAPLDDQDEDFAMSEAISEPLGNEIVAFSSPLQQSDSEEAGEPRRIDLLGKEAATTLSDEEEFHDASELLQVEESPSVAHFDDRASFVTANSQASESREAEDAESPSVRKSKRSSRIRALREESNIQFAKSSRASNRNSRIPPDQSPSPRTTRSQTMSFQQAASPTHEQEDMFARAGLRSPSRRKVSATSANKTKNDLIKRLGTEMPECAPLKDLKSYNMNTLDVAAVVTSTNTMPQRTKARQYVSSFTISDPSTAPQGAIEVSLFRAHKDYLPVVKPGDSILLRRFTVTSLPGRGFGLRTEDESSWAVFNADGKDAAPQVRGPPVELSDKEKSYLVDLRAWHAALEEGAKEKLAEAVGELVQKGKDSRGEQ
ncbi:hypothetical protein KVR01_010963 [Diaporthe batatas]|uniref:uncharacterized protein n=1 Tax=Diaporthe batatas TaxID=748121 RepID=UPI001D0385BD|nr:uncharacterized protein KVR01_010963 [Diaporthe batatas]KAG8159302.1 hypothetical protein KVR01_010963 [Diaporthe batatas]